MFEATCICFACECFFHFYFLYIFLYIFATFKARNFKFGELTLYEDYYLQLQN